MWKKNITNLWIVLLATGLNFVRFFMNEARIFCVIALLLWLTGCTIKFKAKELDLDARPPEAKIGTLTETNHTYELAAIDIFRTDN